MGSSAPDPDFINPFDVADNLSRESLPSTKVSMTRLQCYLSPALTIWECCSLLPQTLHEVSFWDILFVGRWKSKWFGNIWKAMTACGEDWERERREIYSNARGVVLEIGPGTGSSARFFPPASSGLISHVYLIEPNAAFHSTLHQRMTSLGLPHTIIPEPFSPNLSVPANGMVDTVISVLTLCSVSDGPTSCRKIYDLLKPNGQVRCFEHVRGRDVITRAVQWVYDWIWGIPFDNCRLGRPSDEWMFEAGGENGRGWRVFEKFGIDGESPYSTLPTYWGWAVKGE